MSRTDSEASRAPSPVFDTEDLGVRRRGRGDPLSSASSDTSVSEPEDGMSHLDALTKQEIVLDHAKYPSLDLDTLDEVVR